MLRFVLLLRYFVQLAMGSFRAKPWLTCGMIFAISAGIACSMTALTMLHVLSAVPLPQKSFLLFQVGVGDTHADAYSSQPLMSSTEVEALMKAAGDSPRAAFASGLGTVTLPDGGVLSTQVLVRYTTAGFFSLFDAPLLRGNIWGKAEDDLGANVAILSRQRALALFGDASAIGKTFMLGGQVFTVIGVLADWRPAPRFYDLAAGAFLPADDIYVPLASFKNLNSEAFASFACDSDAVVSPGENDKLPQSACRWVSVWLELASPDAVAQFRDNLTTLSRTLLQPTSKENNWFVLANLHDVVAKANVVPGDARLYTLLAFGFLSLCLANVAGLLLAKFMGRAQEVGIRRALGASRKLILLQFLTESALVGLCGGCLGLLTTFVALFFVRKLPAFFADLAHIDVTMLGATFFISIMAGLIAGAVPAWFASRVEPALQVKA
jgi:putative ABC transport system permease protein